MLDQFSSKAQGDAVIQAATETLDRLRALVRQGDPTAGELLNGEIPLAIHLSQVATADGGFDTTNLDAAIGEASAVMGYTTTVPVGPGGKAPPVKTPGLKLGSIVIPWAGVIAAGLFVAVAVFAGQKRRGSR